MDKQQIVDGIEAIIMSLPGPIQREQRWDCPAPGNVYWGIRRPEQDMNSMFDIMLTPELKLFIVFANNANTFDPSIVENGSLRGMLVTAFPLANGQ